jgi:2,4-dienoyl-CoA reductase-like NADH-dependent reductase (Old Yellow Enzyme family)
MSTRFSKLLEPGMIGPVKTRNRMLKTANGTSFMDPDQTCGDRMVAYYERLAKGGIGFWWWNRAGQSIPWASNMSITNQTAVTKASSSILTMID